MPKLRGGLRDLAFEIAADSHGIAIETATRHFRVWPRLQRLLEQAEWEELRHCFIKERVRAFKQSALGKARLSYLRDKRKRLRIAQERALAALEDKPNQA